MFVNHLLFKLRTPDGHEYEIYLNGTYKGFPDGTIGLNYALPIFDAGIENITSLLVSNEKPESIG